MKILMISADPRILTPASDAAGRMREYAHVLGELHIIVFSRIPLMAKRAHNGNLFLYAAYGGGLPMRSFRAWRRGSEIVRGGNVDAITAQGADETGVIAWLLARRFGIPFQLQIHTDIINPRYRRAGWKEHLRYRIARFLIPRAAGVRVVSERIKKSLIASGVVKREAHIAVLPIFTDIAPFAAVVPNPAIEKRFADYDFKIIAAGRFVDKEKNFSMLIDIMFAFMQVCPRALLAIVGEGPDKKKYESKIRNYGLGKNVILEPWRDDLASFYKSFDLFVSPSYYEGWGRAVIEAMAAGLPVIMTDTGLAGEVVKNEENGIVVPVGDTQAFLGAIKMLYENPEKRKFLATAGRETVKNLHPATREEYLAWYRQCFDTHISAPARY